jgi:DNA-binding NarL/FixJ family response regulator
MLLLADEHAQFRRDLRSLLEGQGFAVAAEASDGASAVRLARRLRPALSVIDLKLPHSGGADVAEAILEENPKARVLVLAGPAALDRRDVLDAMIAGACGYVAKDARPAEMIAAVRGALVSEPRFSVTMAARLLTLLRDQRRRERLERPPLSRALTTREREVLRLIAEGRDNAAIASELVISQATVKTHVAHVLKKLGLDNRVQAAVFAVRHGLV